MPSDKEVLEAAKLVSDYCEHSDCELCMFGPYRACIFQIDPYGDHPRDWDIDGIKRLMKDGEQ